MKNNLHWSFGDSSILVNKVFPEGFSADPGTLPSSAGFNPQGEWENTYDVVYAGCQPFTKNAHVYFGSLRIARKMENEDVLLTVSGIRQLQQDYQMERQRLQVKSVCRNDNLLSLKDGTDWSLHLQLENQKDPKTRPFAKMTETGRFQNRVIEKKSAAGSWYTYRTVNAGLSVVSDWSLLASVQTLPKDRTFRFEYFPQLESCASGHQIRFFETFKARFGDRDVLLHGYVQTGPGILPVFYWTDESGRLLIARYALMTLIYNARPYMEREVYHVV